MEDFRQKFINKFNTLFNDINLSKQIEESCYNYTSDYCSKKNIPNVLTNQTFKNIYVLKMRQLFFNCSKININSLLQKNKITIDKIAFLSYLELSPDKWKKFKKDLEIMNKDISINKIEQATTDQFQCGKCKQRKCTYYSVQTRSADEPMTNFVQCLNSSCGNTWRE